MKLTQRLKTIGKNNKNAFSKHLIALFLIGSFQLASAQNENYDYSNYGSDQSYENPDSSYTSEDGNYGSSDYSNSNYFGGSSKSSPEPAKKIIKKPYVRFIPPYDSTHELIIYQAIIEVKDHEGYEVEIDTIYGRAQKWLEAEFGKDLKKIVALNGVNDKAGEMEYKIKVQSTFPCVIQPNEFTSYTSGTVKYDMEIRVRDGRYRYSVKNLVHVADPRPGEKEGVKTYFEFLMKTKDDVKHSDELLIAADKKITSLMADLKKACDTAPIEEDDDW